MIEAKGLRLNYIWVKGHSNIRGNNVADKLAKQSIEEHGLIQPFLPISDLYNVYKNRIRKKWEAIWSSYVTTTKNHYVKMHPTLPSTIPHISTYTVSTFYSTSITRLKLNHGSFPAHLHMNRTEKQPAMHL